MVDIQMYGGIIISQIHFVTGRNCYFMKINTIIGILLILLSLAAMFFWETAGRDMFTTTSVLVCAAPVRKGDNVDASDFRVMNISKDSVLEGAMSPQDTEALEGTVANVDLIENQQILSSYFSRSVRSGKNGQSIFVIPEEWIFSRSSALRSGDTVSIYRMPEKEKLGTYHVAFVRDSSEQEVTDLEPGARTVLERKDSGRKISGIEIICTLDDYSRLYESVIITSVKEKSTEKVSRDDENETADQEEQEDNVNRTVQTEENTVSASLLIVMEDAI